MKKEIPIQVITSKYPARWHFNSIMYERMLNNDYEMIISAIFKYNQTEKEVVALLKMWGWELDASLEKNPYEIIQKGKEEPLTFIQYKLSLNPTIRAIMEEVMKEKESRDILLYLLNNINTDRKKTEEAENQYLEEQNMKKFISTLLEVYEKIKAAKDVKTQ